MRRPASPPRASARPSLACLGREIDPFFANFSWRPAVGRYREGLKGGIPLTPGMAAGTLGKSQSKGLCPPPLTLFALRLSPIRRCFAAGLCPALLPAELLANDEHDERIRQHVVMRRPVAMPRGNGNYIVRFRIQCGRPGARLRVDFLQHAELVGRVFVNDG